MKTLNVHDILLGLICVLSLVLLWKTVNKPESFNTNDSNTIDSQRALDYMVDTKQFVSHGGMASPYEPVCASKIQCK